VGKVIFPQKPLDKLEICAIIIIQRGEQNPKPKGEMNYGKHQNDLL
jgi:hypothetical protein